MMDVRSFSTSTVSSILIILLGWLVQGPAEELLFRGWVFPVISAKYSLGLGILLSSVLFGLVHALNPGISTLAIINLILFGVFTTLYALWEEAIWGVCGIHAVWNWVQGNIFGLEVSGLRQITSLITLQETGPDLFTGGAFGPEGGLLVTLRNHYFRSLGLLRSQNLITSPTWLFIRASRYRDRLYLALRIEASGYTTLFSDNAEVI